MEDLHWKLTRAFNCVAYLLTIIFPLYGIHIKLHQISKNLFTVNHGFLTLNIYYE